MHVFPKGMLTATLMIQIAACVQQMHKCTYVVREPHVTCISGHAGQLVSAQQRQPLQSVADAQRMHEHSRCSEELPLR